MLKFINAQIDVMREIARIPKSLEIIKGKKPKQINKKLKIKEKEEKIIMTNAQ